MKRIENTREMGKAVNGVQQIVADVMVSTEADLTGLADAITGVKLMPGSIALVVQTGVFYVLDDDGEWYTKEVE